MRNFKIDVDECAIDSLMVHLETVWNDFISSSSEKEATANLGEISGVLKSCYLLSISASVVMNEPDKK